MAKRLAILGSTGSIGCNALRVVSALPGECSVAGLCAYSNDKALARQIAAFRPKKACLIDTAAAARLRSKRLRVSVLEGMRGACEICADAGVDHVLIALRGACSVIPLLEAIRNRKEVSLANKESLVMAGDIVMAQARKYGVNIIPIDSEQSAIWQCLQGQERVSVKRIYLTASGGPFRSWPASKLAAVTAAQALKHPRWSMGPKITVDSATMMNKGLEVIEAMHLFGAPADMITVLVHPESVIHSMVEFSDGSCLAQLSVADMRIPIQYAVSYPRRFAHAAGTLDFVKLARMSFEAPDMRRFPCLKLAIRAASEGGSLPAVMNAANEVVVDAFLSGRIAFPDIPRIVGKVMRNHRTVFGGSLDSIFAADNWARERANVYCGG